MFRIIIPVCILLSACGRQENAGIPGENSKKVASLYVWNRDWHSRDITESAKVFADSDFYFLAVEFTGKSTDRVVPAESFFRLKNPMTPVFRIHLDCFRKYYKDIPSLAERIKKEYACIKNKALKAGKRLRTLQVDLDCPVSKLDAYADLMRALEQNLPEGTVLSFTALPCHLKSWSFTKLAESADFYVLQVHGLEVPQNISDKVSVYNHRTAENAVTLAETLGCPYLLALPDYAYQLNFDSETGKFLYLNAEKIPEQSEKVVAETTVPDWNAVSRMVKLAGKELKSCSGIIWFRMPVYGDRFCLDSESLLELQRGEIPLQRITAELEQQKNGTFLLMIKNKGILDIGKVVVNIKWKSSEGIYDLFQGWHTESETPLCGMPSVIAGSIPSPGIKVPVGWFRPENNIGVSANTI